jgi:hypothetical protein
VYWPETIEMELARYPRMNTLETELRDTGFVDLRQEEVRAVYQLTDLTPYRAKVFSCLRLLSEETFQRGLERLKKDLKNGPLHEAILVDQNDESSTKNIRDCDRDLPIQHLLNRGYRYKRKVDGSTVLE